MWKKVIKKVLFDKYLSRKLDMHHFMTKHKFNLM